MNKQKIQEILASVGAGNMNVGGRKVQRTVLYINKDVSAKSGTFQLVEQKTNKEVGVTNLDGGNQFGANRDVIVLGVKAGFDTGTADPKAAVYKNEPTAALKNAEFRIKQGDELFSAPISALYNPGVPTKIADTFFELAPTFIKAQKEYQLEVETPAAVGATTCLKIELDVLMFIS